MKHALWFALLATLLSGCGGGYRRTAEGVQFLGWNKDEGYFSYEVIGADRASFHVLDKHYARDADRVYFEGHVIEHADPASFEVVGPFYGRDATHVFLKNTVIEGASAHTFRLLDASLLWARDDREIYFGRAPVHVAQPSAFRIVRAHWGCDGENYYTDIGTGSSYRVDADYATLQILNSHYAKDRREVFYGVEPIPGADPATFEVIDEITAHDARATYVLGRRQ
jgi:hypothetical protein